MEQNLWRRDGLMLCRSDCRHDVSYLLARCCYGVSIMGVLLSDGVIPRAVTMVTFYASDSLTSTALGSTVFGASFFFSVAASPPSALASVFSAPSAFSPVSFSLARRPPRPRPLWPPRPRPLPRPRPPRMGGPWY